MLKRCIELLCPQARKCLSVSLSICVLWGIALLVRALLWRAAPTISGMDEITEMCRSLLLSVGISAVCAYLIHKTVQTH